MDVQDVRFGPASQSSIGDSATATTNQAQPAGQNVNLQGNQQGQPAGQNVNLNLQGNQQGKNLEAGRRKPRPCFVTWHKHRQHVSFVAPLLTSKRDPKKWPIDPVTKLRYDPGHYGDLRAVRNCFLRIFALFIMTVANL